MRAINRYQAQMDAIPAGAAGAILRILQQAHRGKLNAIVGSDLLVALKQAGFPLRSRQLMKKVNELRKNGALIGASNANGGYYWITTQAELDEFFSRQIFSRITDLRSVYDAMREKAVNEFPYPTPVQPELFKFDGGMK